MGCPSRPIEERFWDHVWAEPMSGCWLFVAGDNGYGYGSLLCNRDDDFPTSRVYAHRLSYEMHVGPIAPGLEIDHKCRVRCCVNPDHLEAVTRKENARRSLPFVRMAQRKRVEMRTHCPSGHKFSPDNTRIHGDGYRVCITCSRAACRKDYWKKKSKPEVRT